MLKTVFLFWTGLLHWWSGCYCWHWQPHMSNDFRDRQQPETRVPPEHTVGRGHIKHHPRSLLKRTYLGGAGPQRRTWGDWGGCRSVLAVSSFSYVRPHFLPIDLPSLPALENHTWCPRESCVRTLHLTFKRHRLNPRVTMTWSWISSCHGDD